MIQFSHVTKEFRGGFTAIRDISFSIEKGDFVFVCGASGAGKTTVIRLLYLDELPSSGRILVCGYDSGAIRPRDLPFFRRKLGIVFQDFRLLSDRDVFENVAFAIRATGQKERLVRRKAFEVLTITGLVHKSSYFPSQLSGGEQQRVCIARAIANDPWLLLADEPTGNLDMAVSREIFALLQSINIRGTTVVMATHDTLLIEPYHYRRLQLSHGALVKDVSFTEQPGKPACGPSK
jgi:cell division transport system ATP-binding protein